MTYSLTLSASGIQPRADDSFIISSGLRRTFVFTEPASFMELLREIKE